MSDDELKPRKPRRSKWHDLICHLVAMEPGDKHRVPIPDDVPRDMFHARIYRVIERNVKDHTPHRLRIRQGAERVLIIRCHAAR